MLTLNDGRSTVNDQEKRKKSSKFETRKVYSRLVKEINDDETFQKEQNDILKSILPQIEKRGVELIKQKKQKVKLIFFRETQTLNKSANYFSCTKLKRKINTVSMLKIVIKY